MAAPRAANVITFCISREFKTVAQNAGEFAVEKDPSVSGSASDAKQEKDTEETNKGVKANEAKAGEKRKADEKDISIERDREISSTQGMISKSPRKILELIMGQKEDQEGPSQRLTARKQL